MPDNAQLSTASRRGNADTSVPRSRETRIHAPVGKADAVKGAFANGYIGCSQVMHHALVGNKVLRRELKVIFDEMVSGPALCCCERAACQDRWDADQNGVWACDYVAPGTFHKGLNNTEGRRVYTVPYTLTHEQKVQLERDFADLVFVSTSRKWHDHPVAHTRNLVATETLVAGYRGRGRDAIVLDIDGNPAALGRYRRANKKAKFVVATRIVSSKDEVRASRRGPNGSSVLEMGSLDRLIEHDGSDILGVADFAFSNHTMYYYTKDELVWLCCNRATEVGQLKPIDFLVHRFDGDSGTLNGGEQRWYKYSVDGVTMVRQENVRTGESYEHPDNSWLFTGRFETWSDYCGRPEGSMGPSQAKYGMAWTVNMLCPDTFVVSCVGIMPEAAARIRSMQAPTVGASLDLTGFQHVGNVLETKIALVPRGLDTSDPLLIPLSPAAARCVAECQVECSVRDHSDEKTLFRDITHLVRRKMEKGATAEDVANAAAVLLRQHVMAEATSLLRPMEATQLALPAHNLATAAGTSGFSIGTATNVATGVVKLVAAIRSSNPQAAVDAISGVSGQAQAQIVARVLVTKELPIDVRHLPPAPPADPTAIRAPVPGKHRNSRRRMRGRRKKRPAVREYSPSLLSIEENSDDADGAADASVSSHCVCQR